MKMLRHYFISDNLNDLEVFEEQLEDAGVSTPQIHVLSRNDAEVEHHEHLHEVLSLMKKDIVHSTLQGAVVGVFASALVLSPGLFIRLDGNSRRLDTFYFSRGDPARLLHLGGGIAGYPKTQLPL